MTIRVVVCDDHPVFREGVIAILDAVEGVVVVGEAGDGSECVEVVHRHQPDVVLMDLRMPGVGGVEATRRITDAHPDVGVLVLTMNEDDDSLFAALRAGARGYLLKEAGKEEIARAIRAVAAGEAMFGSQVAGSLASFFSDRWSGGAVPLPQLTDREREILDLVARGLDNRSVAQRLYVSDKTVRNNVSTILTKLGVSNRAEAVAVARDAGLGTGTPRA